MIKVRDTIAASFRGLPRFRGKGPLGVLLGQVLKYIGNSEEYITTISMRDGSLIQVDVRSRTEQWAYWTGEYDADIVQKLAGCLVPGSVVLDVGANIGFYSIPLGRKLKSLGGRLYAFEPVQNNFDHLVQSIGLNNLEDIVFAHPVALGNEEGFVEMTMEKTNGSNTGNAVMLKGDVTSNLGENSKVRLTTLDSFVTKNLVNSCQLIKIDIEGAEFMFFSGGLNFILKHRPIVYGEFNAYWMEKFGHSLLDVIDIFLPLNYRFFQQARHKRFIEVKELKMGMENILLVPSDVPSSIWSALQVGVDSSP